MDRLKRARRIRGALNAALIVLSVVLVAVGAVYWYLDDPVIRMPPKASIPADLPAEWQAEFERLYSRDPEVHYGAILVLQELGSDDTIPFLVPFLGDNRAPVMRPDFSFSLGYLRDVIWPPPRGRALGEVAAGALSRIGSAAVEPLGVVMLRSRRSVARENAATALVGIGGRDWGLSPFPHDVSNRVGELLAQALQQEAVPLPLIADGLLWSHSVVPPERLVDVIRNSSWDKEPWWLAREQLLREPRGLVPMAAARSDQDPRLRKIAVATLRELAEACKIPAGAPCGLEQDEIGKPMLSGEFPLAGFVALLKDADPKVRRCAVYALGRWGEVAALVPALKDADSGVRLQAACWLARLGEGRGIEALAASIHDEDLDARSAAFEVLSRLDDDRVIEPLLVAEQDQSLHWAALAALADFHRSPALARYIAALRDPNPLVRSPAHRALVLITWEDFGENADAWTAWWEKHKAETAP